MAYSNKFVLSVLHKNAIQKEFADGVVPLPFDSEYGLRLRNKNDRRSLVKVFIDGEDVSGGGWIIPANDKIDIFRSATKDAAFKFVSIESAEAQDFGKNDNKDRAKGVVEARFYLEKQSPFKDHIHHYHHYPWWSGNSWPLIGNPYPGTATYSLTDSKSLNTYKSASMTGAEGVIGASGPAGSPGPVSAQAMNSCASFSGAAGVAPIVRDYKSASAESFKMMDSPVGCTVEGNKTGQTFYSATFHAEENYVAVKIKLQGCEATIQEATGFCVGCGSKRVTDANFCGNCGRKF